MFVATSPLLDGISGRYFEDCNKARPHTGGREGVGVADYALDPDAHDDCGTSLQRQFAEPRLASRANWTGYLARKSCISPPHGPTEATARGRRPGAQRPGLMLPTRLKTESAQLRRPILFAAPAAEATLRRDN